MGKPGRPPRTEAQRAEHRARLVEAAMDGIRQRGPEASIDDLAAAARVSKPVLYDQFGDKLGLADAVAVALSDLLEQRVLGRLVSLGSFELDVAVEAVVEALVNLIDDEPELYGFVVRSIRTSDRGFLDNALVRVVHQRAGVLVGMIAPGVPQDYLDVLTDGMFGFVFASVESWQATKRPSKAELVRVLTVVIREGMRATATDLAADVVAATPP